MGEKKSVPFSRSYRPPRRLPMRNARQGLSSILLPCFLMGCATVPTYTASYDIALREVERPSQAKVRYGEPKITPIQEDGLQKYYFEDDLIKILFFTSTIQIEFVLTNKTDHSIKIVWDEASFVDEKGVGHRVVHGGTKLIDRNGPQPPTVVVRKGTIADLVYPSDYVDWTGSSWHHRPILPNYGETIPGILEKEANAVIGKTIQVLLPLQIEDVVNEYIFSFAIDKVLIKEGPVVIKDAITGARIQ